MRVRAALLALLLVPAGAEASSDLGGFDDLTRWRAAPSEGVTETLARATGPRGPALRLEFDFHGKAGWAAARRDVPVEFPDDWEISFDVRGEGGANDLEVKLVDPTGENVWWSVRREFAPSLSWQPVRLKKRHFSFSWGPAGGGEIRRAAAIEFAVTARAGGRGYLEIADLKLVSRPPAAAVGPPRAFASRSMPGFGPERALDGDPSTAWRATSGSSAPAWIALDFGPPREYGGLTIRWETGRAPSRFFVETSDDGAVWKTVREVRENNGLRTDLFLPESESRQIRLRAPDSAPGGFGVGVAELVVRPLAFGESVNAFFAGVARESPRGTWPRSFSGEQMYWTVAGVSGDSESALFSEDGAAEPRAGAFSVEPFLHAGGRLWTWAEGATRHELEQRDLPIPHAERRAGGLSLDVLAVASGRPGAATLRLRYRVSNEGKTARRATLFLAVRPLQVNPPSQFLNRPGGFAPIRAIAWDGRAVSIDGKPAVFPAVSPSGFGAVSFDAGPITDFLARGALPPGKRADDPSGRAAAALQFDIDLPPHGVDEVSIVLPIHPDGPFLWSGPMPRADARRAFESVVSEVSRFWREELGRVEFHGPPAAAELFRTARVNLADILIERDGPALRPGTRAYARSWIRDGAMMAAALLRLGHTDEARSYAEWYVRFQSAEGRVPCCVDRRGADPVVENDSHGELLFLLAEIWRYTHDAGWLRGIFPHVEGAVSWIDRERQRRRTPEYEAPQKRIFYGLMPESISHEGYSAKPVHSYWDDFWTLKGLKDSVDMAAAAGRPDLAARWSAIGDEFAGDLYASIALVRKTRGIDFIPGSAELGDFDATSTTIALDPGGELDRLPAQALARTFDRYETEFEARLRAPEWDYTPYEIRNVGALVRLGRRERAYGLLGFFLASRRPAEWRGWAEGIASDPRKVKFVGDIPHAWVGSDFIRALIDLFAWTREADGVLVLASGIPRGWFEGFPGPVGVSALRTPYGPLTYSIRKESGDLHVSIEGGMDLPRGGIVLNPPLPPGDCEAKINGTPAPCRNGTVTVRSVPADVVIHPRGSTD
ncbi:MAG: discoidin domain-containing protein [Acidobacteriota bacterium]|nr:discoidin domain-containing protein [Acidobacteriota bacterium]